MRKILAVGLMLLVAAPAMFAMDLGYGVFGGLNMASGDFITANATTGFAVESATKPGIQIGGRVTYPVNDKISVNGQLSYNMWFIGAEEVEAGGSTWKVETSLSNIAIEAEGNYKFNDKFYGILGLGFNMMTIEFKESVSPATPFFPDMTIDDGETKIGINLGAGYKINDMLNAEVKYCMISDYNQIRLGVAYMFKNAGM